MLLALSPEMFERGLGRARSYQNVIAEASGLPAFTSTAGTFDQLRRLGGQGWAHRASTTTPHGACGRELRRRGSLSFAAHGMDCGIENIKATLLEGIAEAFRTVNHSDVEAFVQTGTRTPRLRHRRPRPNRSRQTSDHLQCRRLSPDTRSTRPHPAHQQDYLNAPGSHGRRTWATASSGSTFRLAMLRSRSRRCWAQSGRRRRRSTRGAHESWCR